MWRHNVHSRPPLALLALSAMALAMDHDGPMTDAEKKAREERERLADEAEAKRRAERSERYKQEQDAIAAPYREARRLRNLKKMEQSRGR